MNKLKRARANPTAWRTTEAGVASYRSARTAAQKRADELNIDVGLEPNDVFKTWHTFLLPNPELRSGHELRCEVVRPTKIQEPR